MWSSINEAREFHYSSSLYNGSSNTNDLDICGFNHIYELFIPPVKKMDHSDCDCFLMAILSHGAEGEVYGTNGTIKINKLIDPFKGDQCESLIGKPKIFIIQVGATPPVSHTMYISVQSLLLPSLTGHA